MPKAPFCCRLKNIYVIFSVMKRVAFLSVQSIIVHHLTVLLRLSMDIFCEKQINHIDIFLPYYVTHSACDTMRVKKAACRNPMALAALVLRLRLSTEKTLTECSAKLVMLQFQSVLHIEKDRRRNLKYLTKGREYQICIPSTIKAIASFLSNSLVLYCLFKKYMAFSTKSYSPELRIARFSVHCTANVCLSSSLGFR